MNDVIKSGNIIKKIRDGKQLEEIALFARNCIFRDGPKDTLVLEILSYLKLFQPTFFEKFEDELIETMGLFFKNPSPDTLQGVVFDMYRQHIKEKYGEDYTPMQASILEQIISNFLLFLFVLFILGLFIKENGFTHNFLCLSIIGQGLNIFDLFIVDLLWWRNTKRVRLRKMPEKELYQNPKKHIEAFIRAFIMYLLIALIDGYILTLL